MGDSTNMQAAAAWGQHSSYPSMHRYAQMSQYRQQPMAAYGAPHQQDPKQSFSTAAAQHPIMQQPHQAYQMQQRHTSHYSQAAGGYATSPGQSYAGYMHQRLPMHHQYSHQLEMNAVTQQTPTYNQVRDYSILLKTILEQYFEEKYFI